MSNQEHIIAVLYDLSQTIGSEVKLSPLLKKLLQRLLYHTGYSCGLILSIEDSSKDNTKQCLQVAIGDRNSQKHIGEFFEIPKTNSQNKQLDLSMLPIRQDHYHGILKLPIPKYGNIILLTPDVKVDDPPYRQMFDPILANLTKTIALCKYSEAYTSNLIKDKEKLTDDNLLFRQSLDTSSDFIILVDSDSGKIFDYNKNTASSLEYSSEELRDLPITNLVAKESHLNFTDTIKQIKSSKKSIVSEFRLKNKKNKHFPVEARISLLLSKDKPPILIIVARDITERKKAETQLFNAKQLSETTLNSIGDAVITTDAKGFIDRMNPIAEGLTGYSFKEAKGKPLKSIFSIVNASTGKPIANPVEKVIATGETVFLSNHTTLIAKDKSEFQIADSAAPIRSSDSGILGMVLVFNDVTEQYQLREDILKREQDLQAIMNYSPAVITVKDMEGRIILANKQFEHLFKADHEEVIGKTLFDFFHKDVAEQIDKNDKIVVEQGEVLETEEIVPHADGLHTYISIKFPLRDNNNKIYASCSISTDITDRNKTEEQLRRSQKMDALGQLTGGIAHDYNNMLGVVLGFTELLGLALKDDPKLSKYIDNIRHAGERSTSLTKKLLSFSRKKTSTPLPININSMIKDEKHMLEKILTARITLTLDLAEDLWLVEVDPNDLEDAILNLSINSMQSIKGDGLLTIKTANESIDSPKSDILQINSGDYICLSITDTGSGMDKETTEKIFEPFYTTKGDKGTGLGLSQVYGFVERSKGTIKLDSEVNKGTTFNLYFPKQHSKSKTTDKTNEVKTENLGGTENVLVVDDEPALRDFTSEVLTQNGYTVLSAKDANTALKLIEQNPIDLVISDVIMPKMNGFQLASIIKNKYPKIKIQLVSGFNSKSEVEELDEDLQKNLLSKPFQINQLLKKIRDLLDE